MEIRDITDAVENASNVATGAVIQAAETFSHPGRTFGSGESRRLERKGASARRRIHSEAASSVEDAQEAVQDFALALLPERIVLHGLNRVKARARRLDLVGELAYRGLDAVHGSVKSVAGTFARLERASAPPARPKRPVSRAARTSATQARTATKRRTRRATAVRRSA